MPESFADIRARSPALFSPSCATRRVFDHVMSRWGILVLSNLSSGPQRWGALRRSIDGISGKMLATTLRALVDDGLIERTERATVPPQVEYALTDLGEQLMEHVLPLVGWIADRAGRLSKSTPAAERPVC